MCVLWYLMWEVNSAIEIQLIPTTLRGLAPNVDIRRQQANFTLLNDSPGHPRLAILYEETLRN